MMSKGKKSMNLILLGIIICIVGFPVAKGISSNSATIYQVILPETKHDTGSGTNQTVTLYLPTDNPLPNTFYLYSSYSFNNIEQIS